MNMTSAPLDLVRFALSLILKSLAKVKDPNVRRWLAPIAVALVCVVVIGGLIITYLQVAKPSGPLHLDKPAISQHNNQAQQSSTGNGSPNVQGVQGDVAITVDQSNGKTEVKKVTAEKRKPAKK
jgi:hypothetical protein